MGPCTEGTIFSGGLVGGGAEYAKPSGTDSKTLEGGRGGALLIPCVITGRKLRYHVDKSVNPLLWPPLSHQTI